MWELELIIVGIIVIFGLLEALLLTGYNTAIEIKKIKKLEKQIEEMRQKVEKL